MGGICEVVPQGCALRDDPARNDARQVGALVEVKAVALGGAVTARRWLRARAR